MAFSGVHITYGVIRQVGTSDSIFDDVAWSETMAVAGVTALAAVKTENERGVRVISVLPSFDVFVALGAAPDAAQSPRHLVLSGERALLPCNLGDKVAWIAA